MADCGPTSYPGIHLANLAGSASRGARTEFRATRLTDGATVTFYAYHLFEACPKWDETIKVQRFAFCTYWRLKTDERPFEIDDFETLLLDEWDYVVDPRKIMAEMATKKLRELGYEILDFEAFPR
jgi:hypothetical protein